MANKQLEKLSSGVVDGWAYAAKPAEVAIRRDARTHNRGIRRSEMLGFAGCPPCSAALCYVRRASTALVREDFIEPIQPSVKCLCLARSPFFIETRSEILEWLARKGTMRQSR